MKKFRVTRYNTILDVYERFIEAETEEEAIEISRTGLAWELLRKELKEVTEEAEEA